MLRDNNMKVGFGAMPEVHVAASLMMNIKTGPQQCSN